MKIKWPAYESAEIAQEVLAEEVAEVSDACVALDTVFGFADFDRIEQKDIDDMKRRALHVVHEALQVLSVLRKMERDKPYWC